REILCFQSIARDHKGKTMDCALDSLLIMPVQRIPRYELLIKLLLKHTDKDHPDHQDLLKAQHELHNLALKINRMEKEALEWEQGQQILRDLETQIEGLAHLHESNRQFLRYDLVTMPGSLGTRRERALFLFSDLLLICSIKRRGGTQRRLAVTHKSASALEGNKYKLLVKIALENMDIAKAKDENLRKLLREVSAAEADLSILNQMADLVSSLHAPHAALDEALNSLSSSLNKQLQEKQGAENQLLCVDVSVTSQDGSVDVLQLNFLSPENRSRWEETFMDAKQKIAEHSIPQTDHQKKEKKWCDKEEEENPGPSWLIIKKKEKKWCDKEEEEKPGPSWPIIKKKEEKKWCDKEEEENPGPSWLIIKKKEKKWCDKEEEEKPGPSWPIIKKKEEKKWCDKEEEEKPRPSWPIIKKKEEKKWCDKEEEEKPGPSWPIIKKKKEKSAQYVSERPPPEFLMALPVRKTRAGLQFTCGTPTLGPPDTKDVWVCNSDGYVGQVCVLSLYPEPAVMSCNGVCNSRILCITSIPIPYGPTASEHHHRQSSPLRSESANGKLLSSLSSEFVSNASDSNPQLALRKEGSVGNLQLERWVNRRGSTMWIGTEDGGVHVYNCNDNIRVKKNKIKIQHPAAVTSIIYLDNRVFVAIGNGQVCVYRRDHVTLNWLTQDPEVLNVGSPEAPVLKMISVAGRLWCGCLNIIKVVNPGSMQIEHSFVVHQDTGRPINSMASSGLYVWVSLYSQPVIRLYHATTLEALMDINIGPAVTKMLMGTSAGVVLNVAIPPILSNGGEKPMAAPNVIGVPHGHTGHVRFLSAVEVSYFPQVSAATAAGVLSKTLLPNPGAEYHGSTNRSSSTSGVSNSSSSSGALGSNRPRSPSSGSILPLPVFRTSRRNSATSTTSTGSSTGANANSNPSTGSGGSKILIISGGDGYEDFRCSKPADTTGRDDSTNHLLLWKV
ncbi:unnamed protein product, partial [Cyprideis torosa]